MIEMSKQHERPHKIDQHDAVQLVGQQIRGTGKKKASKNGGATDRAKFRLPANF
jgi:hypothetical protein